MWSSTKFWINLSLLQFSRVCHSAVFNNLVLIGLRSRVSSIFVHSGSALCLGTSSSATKAFLGLLSCDTSTLYFVKVSSRRNFNLAFACHHLVAIRSSSVASINLLNILIVLVENQSYL